MSLQIAEDPYVEPAAVLADLFARTIGGLPRGSISRVLVTARHRSESTRTLTALMTLLGWAPPDSQPVHDFDEPPVTADDHVAAASIGRAIRPVILAELSAASCCTFTAPAWLPASHPLATAEESLDTILCEGPTLGRLCLSGPALAAALADTGLPRSPRQSQDTQGSTRGLDTRWIVRLAFPGIPPPDQTIGALTTSLGMCVERVFGRHLSSSTRWIESGAQSPSIVQHAIETLARRHRVVGAAFRQV